MVFGEALVRAFRDQIATAAALHGDSVSIRAAFRLCSPRVRIRSALISTRQRLVRLRIANTANASSTGPRTRTMMSMTTPTPTPTPTPVKVTSEVPTGRNKAIVSCAENNHARCAERPVDGGADEVTALVSRLTAVGVLVD